MIDKYLIKMDDVTLGLKYNSETGIAVIGGHKKFRLQMQSTFKNAFGNPRYTVTEYETRNIVRLSFRSRDAARIDNGVEWMCNNGYVVERVKRLEFIR